MADLTKIIALTDDWNKGTDKDAFISCSSPLYVFWTDGSSPTESIGHYINPHVQVQNKAGTSLYVKATIPNDVGTKIFITEE